MNKIYLKHAPSHEVPCASDFEEHFYDGAVKVHKGVVEVPVEKKIWIERLQALGFVIITEDEFRQARGLTPLTPEIEESTIVRQAR